MKERSELERLKDRGPREEAVVIQAGSYEEVSESDRENRMEGVNY